MFWASPRERVGLHSPLPSQVDFKGPCEPHNTELHDHKLDLHKIYSVGSARVQLAISYFNIYKNIKGWWMFFMSTVVVR